MYPRPSALRHLNLFQIFPITDSVTGLARMLAALSKSCVLWCACLTEDYLPWNKGSFSPDVSVEDVYSERKLINLTR